MTDGGLYNIQALKLGRNVCIGVTILTGLVAWVIYLGQGFNTSHWYLFLLFVFTGFGAIWSWKEIKLRLIEVKSKTFKQ